MGVDIQALRILNHSKSFGDFKKTLTIGRQGLHSPAHAIEVIFNTSNFKVSDFCEDLFIKLLGSTSVDSIIS